MATRQEALDCFNNLLTNFNLKDSGIRLEYIKGGMYRLWNVDVCVTTFYDAREVIAGVTMLRAMLPAMECKNKTKNAKDLVMNQYPNAYTKQRGDGLWYVAGHSLRKPSGNNYYFDELEEKLDSYKHLPLDIVVFKSININ